MELKLTRKIKSRSYTKGTLSISERIVDEYASGERLSYLCDTLEPTWRDYRHGAYRVKDNSAIPEGRYAVVVSYSPQHKQWLPLLLGDQEFKRKWKDIRIHAGSSAMDTTGSILVGSSTAAGQLLDSWDTLCELKQKIVDARNKGEAVWLTVS